MFTYLGTCITTVDDDQIWDATEMAQLIENSEPFVLFPSIIPYTPDEIRESLELGDISRFIFGRNGSIVWVYDEETDIHYFYKDVLNGMHREAYKVSTHGC